MARAFLIITGLLWVLYGVYLLVMPQELAAMAGVAATNATGTVELRAMYGGLQTAIGALALLAGVSPAWRRSGLATLLFVYAGLALARLGSASRPGSSRRTWWAESHWSRFRALIAWALLRREWRPTALRL